MKKYLWDSPVTWKAYINRALTDDALTSEEKKRVSSGLDFLSDLFGDKFLERIFMLDLPEGAERHVMVYLLADRSPSSQLAIGQLGDELNALKGCPKFQVVKGFLKDASKFNTSLAQIRVATNLQAEGYEIELEPKVGNGKADILAKKPNDELFVEVSTVGASDEEKYARDTTSDVWTPLLLNGCLYAGRIYRILSIEERTKYRQEIARIIEEVNSEKMCREIHHNNALNVFVAPKDQVEQLERCLKAKGLENGCYGPVLNYNNVARIISRFEHELRQLPDDKPGMIVVYASDLMPFYIPQNEVLQEIADQMESVMSRRCNVIMFVLVVPEGCFESHNKYERSDPHSNRIVVKRPLFKETRENVLVVKNISSKFVCSTNVLDALIGHEGRSSYMLD